MAGTDARAVAKRRRNPGDGLALPIVLTWAIAQLAVIVMKLPTPVWIAPALIAALLSLMVTRRREAVVYIWVAAMFFVLYLLVGDLPEG